MIYCDTSLIVAALAFEAATPRAQDWMAARGAGELCVSPWVGTELSSALSLKLRRGELTLAERADALMQWHVWQAETLVMVEVPSRAWDMAARFSDRHELGLRAADALHLAVASLGGHALATLDVAMAASAVSVGVTVEEVLP